MYTIASGPLSERVGKTPLFTPTTERNAQRKLFPSTNEKGPNTQNLGSNQLGHQLPTPSHSGALCPLQQFGKLPVLSSPSTRNR